MSVATIFDESHYLSSNADVVLAISQGIFASALQHYQLFGGKSELRDPNASFNASYYAAQNPDVLTAVSSGLIANVFSHYQMFGEAENRAPTADLASFDAAGYLAANADVQAAVTAGTIASALEHYITFGASEGRDGTGITTFLTIGSTFTLTNNVDRITGTSGIDTFIADRSSTNDVLSAADKVDAGAGTDIIQIYNKAAMKIDELPLSVFSNYETLEITNGALTSDKTLDVSGVSGLSSLFIKNPAALTNDGSFTFKTASTTALNLKGVTGTAAGINVETVNVDGATSLGVNGLVDLTVDLTSNGSSLNINATGADSEITLANSGAALTSLTLEGDKKLTIKGLQDFAGTSATIDASKATGDVVIENATNGNDAVTFTGGSGKNTIRTGNGKDNLTGGAKADDFAIGGGDDKVNSAGGDDLIEVLENLSKNDIIDGGDGIDTLLTTQSTIDEADKAAAAGVSNVEVFATISDADVDIDFKALSTFNTVALSTADATQAAAEGNGNVSGTTNVSVANVEDGDSLSVQEARAGQHGQANNEGQGGAGGDAINITPAVDGGSNSFTIQFVGNADITGGDGGDASGNNGDGSLGGDGIDAALFETLNFEVQGTSKIFADIVKIAAGAAGAKDGDGTGSSDGNSIEVEHNGKIVLTSSLKDDATKHNNIDLGDVKGTNVTVDGSAFLGNIKVTADDGNVVLKGGAGIDDLTGGTGIDNISGGAGDDKITGGAGGDQLSGGDGKDNFVIGTGAGAVDNVGTVAGMDKISDFVAADDKLTFSGDTVAGVSDTAGATAAINVEVDANGKVTFAAADDTLAEKLVAVAADNVDVGNDEVVFFEDSGNTYVYGAGDVTAQAADDFLIELTGITGLTELSAAANVFTFS